MDWTDFAGAVLGAFALIACSWLLIVAVSAWI